MRFIYLLESTNEDRTVYKIGYTGKSVRKRIDELQTGNPYEIKELYKFQTKYNRKIEVALHNYYNHKRIKNEWFEIDISEVADFMKTCERIEKNFDLLQENTYLNFNI